MIYILCIKLYFVRNYHVDQLTYFDFHMAFSHTKALTLWIALPSVFTTSLEIADDQFEIGLLAASVEMVYSASLTLKQTKKPNKPKLSKYGRTFCKGKICPLWVWGS